MNTAQISEAIIHQERSNEVAQRYVDDVNYLLGQVHVRGGQIKDLQASLDEARTVANTALKEKAQLEILNQNLGSQLDSESALLRVMEDALGVKQSEIDRLQAYITKHELAHAESQISNLNSAIPQS